MRVNSRECDADGAQLRQQKVNLELQLQDICVVSNLRDGLRCLEGSSRKRKAVKRGALGSP